MSRDEVAYLLDILHAAVVNSGPFSVRLYKRV